MLLRGRGESDLENIYRNEKHFTISLMGAETKIEQEIEREREGEKISMDEETRMPFIY